VKRFFIASSLTHVLFVAFLLTVGALRSKSTSPTYTIDLVTSFGGGSPEKPAPPVVAVPASKPIVAPPSPAPVEEEDEPQDDIFAEDKTVKHKPKAKKAISKEKEAIRDSGQTDKGQGATAGSATGMGAAGPALVATEGGIPFPYPWYLKTIADRLDKQWKPPQQFQSDTLCQITFEIRRDGQISGSSIEKSSGDGFFDQLALRAVLYASPLPPLPAGYPESNLKVHMKFVGKRS